MMQKLHFKCFLLLLVLIFVKTSAISSDLITNIPNRKTTSLNGKWQYIIDIYETGFYDYRYRERAEKDPEAYWNTDVPANSLDRKEHGYNDKYTLNVPGDWNSQADKFLYYEGTVWYKKSFDYKKSDTNNKLYVYFGAVSYRADVYLNGKKLGMHKGAFSPFNFEIPSSLLKEKDNFLVVKVDNRRYADEIPTLNTDWWNYGGIIRDVSLVEVPNQFISNYFIQLAKPHTKSNLIEGWVEVKNAKANEEVYVEIPELKINQKFTVNAAGRAEVKINAPKLKLWSLENPKLYQVNISSKADKVSEKIGFRNIEVQGEKVLLNGKSLFLRGISIHSEIPQEGRRANTQKDANQLLGWARELGCNMVRLAHYPHDEKMTRLADSLGLLVWSEIPVYWTIDFTSDKVFEKAKTQLDEMIDRDKNRASIIIWSVGNETPVSEVRTNFMKNLLAEARKQDPTRLVSAALEVNYHSEENMRWIDDPLGAYVDIVSFNQYLGWYGGTPESCRTANWGTHYKKPLFISETGAEAVGGFNADAKQLWSEEFQEWYYKEQVDMLKRMPSNFIGISPWILADFRSPRRNNPVYQEGWNNKGLYDHQGRKKKAFYVLKGYYDELAKKYK
ncbi:Beta-glucuronidase [Pseudopedobacter saltans DSM 12145]|uniref:Beta-glucuronidase n=1 Tax=Pseudopedobacter saltans (strain ATCC 51119 / DSM 12145 / JCM 21818 / CCUG 39354 / LMG 10337 / NBRC 100064 / NCIMB 13643) TaxID=762903 RepID=F0S667_PSESL|nr:glycoside hydrolase family 2 TIM barrel-domain containing protein [Pseudopedobacter saltans]ADY53181.1 Beta-glucuronidase [Pseudopedobacter saltans DSM 12145]